MVGKIKLNFRMLISYPNVLKIIYKFYEVKCYIVCFLIKALDYA